MGACILICIVTSHPLFFILFYSYLRNIKNESHKRKKQRIPISAVRTMEARMKEPDMRSYQTSGRDGFTCSDKYSHSVAKVKLKSIPMKTFWNENRTRVFLRCISHRLCSFGERVTIVNPTQQT